MVEDVFQHNDEPPTLEERAIGIVGEVFGVVDGVEEEANGGHDHVANISEDLMEIKTGYEVVGEMPFEDGLKCQSFDPTTLKDVIQELYPNNKCTKLTRIIFLMNLCTIHGITNKFNVDEIFTFLCLYLLLEPICLLNNFYIAKTLTRQLGLDYKTIHACTKGCVLFQGEHQNVIHCPKCGGPHYKDEINKMFHVKVFRHFSVAPILQRMYRSPTLSQLMLWHSQNYSLDGMVKHPCDSKLWKHVHDLYPSFAIEPRKVHPTFLADGANPFKFSCSVWSTWPIFLLNYNIPPWLTTKKISFCSHYLFRAKNQLHQRCLMCICNHWLKSFNHYGMEL
jgi:hypothetical protein